MSSPALPVGELPPSSKAMPGSLFSTELFLRAQTDDRLLALAGQGHGLAFAVLAGRHRSALLAHARHLVGEDGEDVLQQALLRAWSSLQRGVEVRHAAAWLHRIVHNSALDELRRTRRGSMDPLPEDEPDGLPPDAIVEERIEVREILRSLAMLPERQRLALLGTVVDGRSRRQLATELGLSEGAVRQLVHRARSGLRGAVAAVVPYSFVVRLSHRYGWAGGRDAAPSLHGSAQAATASGVATAGVLKATTAVIAVTALGGGLLMHASAGLSGQHGSSSLGMRPSDRSAPGRLGGAAAALIIKPSRAEPRLTSHASGGADAHGRGGGSAGPTAGGGDGGRGSSKGDGGGERRQSSNGSPTGSDGSAGSDGTGSGDLGSQGGSSSSDGSSGAGDPSGSDGGTSSSSTTATDGGGSSSSDGGSTSTSGHDGGGSSGDTPTTSTGSMDAPSTTQSAGSSDGN